MFPHKRDQKTPGKYTGCPHRFYKSLKSLEPMFTNLRPQKVVNFGIFESTFCDRGNYPGPCKANLKKLLFPVQRVFVFEASREAAFVVFFP